MRVVIVVFSVLAVAAGARFTWTHIPRSNAAPPARWFSGVAYYMDSLYVFGGRGVNNVVLDDTRRFDISGGTGMWSLITNPNSTKSPPPRYGFVGGVTEINGNTAWIISHGRRNSDDFYDDTWYFDFTTEQWNQLENVTNAPRARYSAAGGVYPGSGVLWMSMGWGEGKRRLSDTWILNITSRSWERVSSGGGLNQYNPFIPHARASHAGSPVSEDTFVIFGGCAGGGQVGGPCPLGDSWMIDLKDKDWKQLPDCPIPKIAPAMTWLPGQPNHGLVWGGTDAGGPGVFPQKLAGPDYEASDTDVVNTDREDWTVYRSVSTLGNNTFPARAESPHLAVDVDNNRIFLFGGRTIDDDEALLADVWVLTGNQTDSPDDGCPSPTFTFVHLHGTLMYLAWGLFLPLGALLGRYHRWTWPCWFVFHIILQSAGVLLTVAGFVIIFLVGSYEQPTFAHAIVGIVLTAILLQQFMSGIFHPCVEKENGKTPSEEKSLWRRCWEIYHGISGAIAIAIGLGQVTLGVLLIVPPMPVWIVWSCLAGLWVITFVVHEIVYLSYKIVRRNDDKER